MRAKKGSEKEKGDGVFTSCDPSGSKLGFQSFQNSCLHLWAFGSSKGLVGDQVQPCDC